MTYLVPNGWLAGKIWPFITAKNTHSRVKKGLNIFFLPPIFSSKEVKLISGNLDCPQQLEAPSHKNFNVGEHHLLPKWLGNVTKCEASPRLLHNLFSDFTEACHFICLNDAVQKVTPFNSEEQRKIEVINEQLSDQILKVRFRKQHRKKLVLWVCSIILINIATYFHI